MKKVKQILIPYWRVYVVLLLVGLITHIYMYTGGQKLFWNFCVVPTSYVVFWHVAFYIASMMLLTVSAKFCDNFLTAIVSEMIFPYGIGVCVNYFMEFPVAYKLSDSRCIYILSCSGIFMGHICSKFDVFEMIDRYNYEEREL